MRIAGLLSLNRRARPGRRVAFTVDSELGATILRMIASQSFSAFTPSVGRAGEVQQVRGIAPTAPVRGQGEAAAAQRSLESVPSKPVQVLPRGSLLDLRV
ncbi:hypothetical protein [Roseicella frigidaeris]|uniref:Uncharacterized protein n=1 Tax=Roseicella frigidaeris TaxID=2230885 RepID=A0A327MLK3_9PROT|nr:hypothetical protein [Roseicella frigidaeris]RAI61018.1 hypothetical protein DOO78_02510 [Roseicella frigidaeris]